MAIAVVFAAPAGAATRILAVGDFGVGGSTERATGAAIEAWEAEHPASLLLTLGDNDYTESPPTFRSNWHDAFGWLEAAGVRPRGTLGNHDVRVDGGRYEFKALRMPSSHYQRSRPNFDLFVLNSNSVGDGQTRIGEDARRIEARGPGKADVAVERCGANAGTHRDPLSPDVRTSQGNCPNRYSFP